MIQHHGDMWWVTQLPGSCSASLGHLRSFWGWWCGVISGVLWCWLHQPILCTSEVVALAMGISKASLVKKSLTTYFPFISDIFLVEAGRGVTQAVVLLIVN